MYGLNQTLALSPFVNVYSIVYGVSIAAFLGWLCKGVKLGNEHLVILRYGGLWRTTVEFSEIHFAGYKQEARSYSFTIRWPSGLIRLWPLTCFGMDELAKHLPALIEQYRERRRDDVRIKSHSTSELL